MPRKLKYPPVEVGQIFNTNSCGTCTVISFTGRGTAACRAEVEFESGYIADARVSELRRGCVKDPLFKSIFGIGYLGVGKYTASMSSYDSWRGVLERCLNPDSHMYKHYKHIKIDERWHNYQNFAEWHTLNYVKGYHLDKDLLGGGVYSPDTCVYIPKEVNTTESQLRATAKLYPELQEVYDLYLAKCLLLYCNNQ